MPLGRTWRDVLEDPSVALDDVVAYAGQWDTCAVGERVLLLGLVEDDERGFHPDRLVDRKAAESKEWKAYLERDGELVVYDYSPGLEFLRMVERHDRKRALEVLAAIETVQPGVA